MPNAFLVLDIETADAPEDSVQNALAAWKPPGNCKNDDTIETRRQEAATRIRDRAALLDASPIICVAFISGGSYEQIIMHSMEAKMQVAGWRQIAAPSEQVMLLALRQWLNANTNLAETTLVGHNIRSFDLPKIRQAYIRHRLKLPEILLPRLDGEAPVMTVDTMHLIRSFSMELRDERYISLDKVAAVLGIDRPKQVVSGAMVPGMYRDGQYQEILTYCAIDTATTARAYLLMSGQAPDLH